MKSSVSHFLIKEPIQDGHPGNTTRFDRSIGEQINVPQSFFASQPHGNAKSGHQWATQIWLY